MLSFEIKGKILHVVEVLMSWTHTQVRHWYYDLESWKCSSHGRLGDTPDRDMTESDIAWVKKYYLPRVGILEKQNVPH